MNNRYKKGNYRALIPINKCTLCDITAKETNSSFIEVDHKDKDHLNNEKSNLWALCKFCHNMKTKYEHHLDEKTFWAIAIGTLPENDEKKPIQRFDKKKNVVHILMTIKEFIYQTSLDYFNDKETLKEHYVIVNIFEDTLEKIKDKYYEQIQRKIYPIRTEEYWERQQKKYEMKKLNMPNDYGDWN